MTFRKNKIIRTGLAAMLAGLFFAACFSATESYACDRMPPESDSALIERHIREDVYNGEDSAAEDGLRIEDAYVQWSPDSAFRICTIKVQFCGAYCNYQWLSWLHFNDDASDVISDLDFGEIAKISLMRDGKYFILGAFYGRDGTFSCRTDEASLFSIVDHKIVYHKMPDPIGNAAYRRPTFSVSFCTYMSTQSSLEYDDEKHELRYSCGEDTGLTSTPDSVTVYSGILSYADTTFVVTKHTQRRIKYIAPE